MRVYWALAVLTTMCVTGPATASELSLKNAVAEAAPIESSIQLCYGQLSYQELTDDERIRMQIASAKLDNIISRFATAHTVAAYEEAEDSYLELLVYYNTRNSPPPVCDSDHVGMIEEKTDNFLASFGSVKGPRMR